VGGGDRGSVVSFRASWPGRGSALTIAAIVLLWLE
jgi:hypothetical protein